MEQPCISMSRKGIGSDGRKASARDPLKLLMSDANSDIRNKKLQACCVWRQGNSGPKKMFAFSLARAGTNRRSLIGGLIHERYTKASIHENIQPNRIKG
jgi:hypothetical protein